ncbi:ParB/RepB/Spo0J family partition protein [Herbaspirillum lusitanum]|uniref:ParB/RepB/Spo0J family partition protein n=1 Tax=Herbaspirillum lusitanum TaxID=213312 RepID=UPI002238F7CF|nr:ParB/RepB/Spo0J family partition protein [Herbaspirillum lusitanum]
MNQVTQAQFGMIPLQFIETDPNQPRRTFDENALQELADSIKVSGVIQPILLRTIEDSDTRLQLVAGERRYRASQIAGLTEIPGIVRQLSDAEVAIIQLVENHQRAGVPPLEEAEAMARAMRDHGLKIDDICTELGVKRRWAYSRLQLLDLCAEARIGLNDGRLAPSTALLIARIPVASLQERAAGEVLTNNGAGSPMSYRQAKTWIEQRYTLDINRAVFSLVDAKLCKAAGSCAECPKRTANDPDKFPDITADVCTDPDCFEMKTEAHNTAEIDKAAKKKIRFYESWEQCKTERNGDLSTDFVLARTFDRLINADHQNMPVDDLLGTDRMPKPIGIFKNLSGHITNIYSKSDIQCALEKAGLARTEAEEEEFDKQEEQQRIELAKEKKATDQEDPAAVLRNRLGEINWKIAKAYNVFHEDLLEEIKDLVDQQTLLPIYRTLAVFSAGQAARSEQLSFSQKVDESYNVDFMEAAAVEELVEHASDEDVCRLHLDAVLSNIPSVYGGAIDGGLIKFEDEWEEWNYQHYQTLIKLGNICGIDIDLLRDKHLAEPLQELAEAMTPTKKEPTEEPAETPKPKAAKKQPARPKKTAPTPDADPNAAWPFPKSKDGS